MQARKCVSNFAHSSPFKTKHHQLTITTPCFNTGKDPMKTLTPRSHYTSTQYDFDLNSGAILHVNRVHLRSSNGAGRTFSLQVRRESRRSTNRRISKSARCRECSSGFLSAQSRHPGCELLAHKI